MATSYPPHPVSARRPPSDSALTAGPPHAIPPRTVGCRVRIDGGTPVNRYVLLAVCASTALLGGCASTWDTVSGRDFRNAPFKTVFSNDDPMTVLRTKVDGESRAKAMRRLKEPAANGGGAAEQDEALTMLGTAATADPSPLVRCAAVDALGRFRDPKALPLLVAAYHRADGVVEAKPKDPAGDIQPAAGIRRAPDPFPLTGPTGFPPEFVSVVRTKVVQAMALSEKPEAVRFLADVATGRARKETDPADEKEVRVAAVKGLGRMRQKEAVVALAAVLKDEGKKDMLMAHRAHEGLVELTGKRLPADGDKWAEVVQAGFEIQPEPNALQRALGGILP